MEFTNDISFDSKLTENKIAKINYHGNLVKNGANSISIVYGFGPNWDNTDAKEMQKVADGFETEIKMQSFDTFNFCFRNENYNWDNNNYCNYISSIEKEVVTDVNSETTKEGLDTQDEIKNIEEEISLLFDTLFNETNNNVQKATSSIPNIENKVEKTQEFNLDNLIDEILNPVVSDSASLIESIVPEISAEQDEIVEKYESEVTELPTYTQKTSTLVDDILVPYYADQTNDISNSDVSKINDLDNLIENLVSITVEQAETQNVESEVQEQKEVINIITPTFETPTQEIEGIDALFEENDVESENVQKIEEKTSNKKISDFTILDEKIETEQEEPSLLEEVTQDKLNSKVEESVALSVIEENSGLTVSPRKLGKLYFAKKKVKLALYKALVSIPKFLAKQFKSSDNN
jgi:hypothetical protein